MNRKRKIIKEIVCAHTKNVFQWLLKRETDRESGRKKIVHEENKAIFFIHSLFLLHKNEEMEKKLSFWVRNT